VDEAGQRGNDGRSVVSTRTMEAVVAALLFLFGATFVYQSYELGFRWAVEGPQSGFFPFYVALIICGSSLVVFVNALRGKAGRSDESFVERGQLWKVMQILIPAAIFVLGVQLIGIYVSSVIYIALFMLLVAGIGMSRLAICRRAEPSCSQRSISACVSCPFVTGSSPTMPTATSPSAIP